MITFKLWRLEHNYQSPAHSGPLFGEKYTKFVYRYKLTHTHTQWQCSSVRATIPLSQPVPTFSR